jgi:hypothetical protein
MTTTSGTGALQLAEREHMNAPQRTYFSPQWALVLGSCDVAVDISSRGSFPPHAELDVYHACRRSPLCQSQSTAILL